MKTLLSLMMIALMSVGAYAQEPVLDDNATMDFDFETHDFGELVEGDDATMEFTFVNNGNTDLIITNVKASCGCTTPFWSKEPVAPGETGKITAKYNTVGRPGRFNKPITITSNATTPTVRIFIKGEVKEKPEFGAPEKKPSIVSQ